jgi:transposase
VESWHDLGDSGRRAGGDWYFPDGQAGTVAATRQLEPVGRGPIADAEFVRLLTHRLGEMAERARERMDRLGQLDAASQDAVIEVVRAREEQLSGLPARAVPHHRPARGRDRRARAQVAPQLLAEPGFGPLTAGKLIGEIAGAQRFASDAKLARAGGIAPIPVSSGNTNRHRLDRGGNRQINTRHPPRRVTRARCHPETKACLQRKRTEGKTHREAIRCLKRHLARPAWHLLQPPDPPPRAPALNIHLLT